MQAKKSSKHTQDSAQNPSDSPLLSGPLAQLAKEGIVWVAENASGESAARAQNLKTHSCSTTAYSFNSVPFGSSIIDQALTEGGLSFGAIHEFNAEHEPLTLLSLLVANTTKLFGASGTAPNSKFIVWIGQSAWPTPFILNAICKELLPRCLFLSPKDHKQLFWSIDLCLRSDACAIVIASIDKLPFATSKRFAYLAKKNSTLAFFLRPFPEITKSSAAQTKWRLSPLPSPTLHPQWKLSLLKKKGAQSKVQDWNIEIQITPYKAPVLRVVLGVPWGVTLGANTYVKEAAKQDRERKDEIIKSKKAKYA